MSDSSTCPAVHHLLHIEDVSIGFAMYDPNAPYFAAKRIVSPVARNVNLSVDAGEVVALVGASGSGKTVLADAIMGFWQPNEIISGRIWFDGRPLDGELLASLCGRGISSVPQSVSYLDPLMTVGRQVLGAPRGVTRRQRQGDRDARIARMRALFAQYGLDAAVGDMYPHQLSGGMLRRVLLLCALMDEPRLIVADEPTPGLDMELAARAVGDLRTFADAGGGALLITHDIELALRCADRIAVFHEGTVVEEAPAVSFSSADLLEHPFSKALWHALPSHEFQAASFRGDSSLKPPGTGVSESRGTGKA